MKKWDYRVAKVLYAQGIPLSEIARQTGLPYAALSKFAARNKWEQDRNDASEAVTETTRKTLAERAAHHVNAISELADNAISALRAKPVDLLKLSELEVLSRVAENFDKIARRAYQIDTESNGPQQLVQVVVAGGGAGITVKRHVNTLDSLDLEDEGKRPQP